MSSCGDYSPPAWTVFTTPSENGVATGLKRPGFPRGSAQERRRKAGIFQVCEGSRDGGQECDRVDRRDLEPGLWVLEGVAGLRALLCRGALASLRAFAGPVDAC